MDDFQDLPAWRELVVQTGRVLAQQYGQLVITPMTLTSPSYSRLIFGGFAASGVAVKHIYLKVPADTLRQRISAQVIHPEDPGRDREVRAWRLAQASRCALAEDSLPPGTVLLDGEQPTSRLAEQVWQLLATDPRFARPVASRHAANSTSQ